MDRDSAWFGGVCGFDSLQGAEGSWWLVGAFLAEEFSLAGAFGLDPALAFAGDRLEDAIVFMSRNHGARNLERTLREGLRRDSFGVSVEEAGRRPDEARLGVGRAG